MTFYIFSHSSFIFEAASFPFDVIFFPEKREGKGWNAYAALKATGFPM